MPVEIVLIRHGQSEGNRDRVFAGHNESGLTDLGRRQAEATAEAVLALTRRAEQRARARAQKTSAQPLAETPPIDEIIASDLVRAVETATPLCRLSGLPLTQSAAIRERDVGLYTGLRFEEVQARYPDGWSALLARDPEYAPPDGESHRQCRQRVGRFLDELVARRSSGRVVIYSHGVAINHMLRHVVGALPTESPRFFFEVENCSLHRIDHLDEGVFRIVATNQTAHLSDVV